MLGSPSGTVFIDAAVQLFRAIQDAFRRRILHRDISINNILVANDQLLLVDWEMGQHFDEPWSASAGTLTGTLDTMAVGALVNFEPLPHDDIESAIYVLLKVLTQKFVPPEDRKNEWSTILAGYRWDDPNMDTATLRDSRGNLWIKNDLKQGSTIYSTLVFIAPSEQPLAQLLYNLLSLPLPAQRLSAAVGIQGLVPLTGNSSRLVDSSNYDTVLSSLGELVNKAIAAVTSVDAGTLCWNI
ncbi:hypothetical protein B0H19DRAFT_1249539 [Mycena capillaripes]|nr:hypothetical protein B0H19DRAFT_1249539 [Mycena capillaripes]